MKRKKYIIIIAIFISVIGSSVLYVFRKSTDTVKRSKHHIEIAANNLVSDYTSNEMLADSIYLDKVILTKGVVTDIVKTNYNRYTLFLKGDSGNVSCLLGESQTLPQNCIKGCTVKIKGKCAGYAVDVLMNKCVLVD